MAQLDLRCACRSVLVLPPRFGGSPRNHYRMLPAPPVDEPSRIADERDDAEHKEHRE